MATFGILQIKKPMCSILLFLFTSFFPLIYAKPRHLSDEKILLFSLTSCPNKLSHTLHAIFALKRHSSHKCDCTISMHISRKEFLNLPWDQENLLADAERVCNIYFAPGAHYGDNIRMVFPYLLKKANYKYILFVQDDLQMNKYNLDEAIYLMKLYNLSLGSPLVKGAAHFPVNWSPDTKYTANEEATGVHPAKMLEAFVLLFTFEGWDCFWEACDPLQNSKGWGFDQILYASCREKYRNFRMGVFLKMIVTHMRGEMPCPVAVYPDNHRLNASQQYHAFMQTDTYKRLKPIQDAAVIDWIP